MVPRIAIVIGSTRPSRKGEAIAAWAHEIAAARDDLHVELIDLAEQNLPLFDEPSPPIRGHYTQPHTLAWSELINSFDGYVFVASEYNHSAPAAIKNAIDYLHAEWANKAAAFISYGVDGGVRSVEQLRLVLASLQVATVSAAPPIRLFTDLGPDGRPTDPRHTHAVNTMLDQLAAWSQALTSLREPHPAVL